jgi:hypothetical protein
VGIEDVGEQPVVAVDVVTDLLEVVRDVSEQVVQVRAEVASGTPLHELGKGRGERSRPAAELQHLPLEPVDRGRDPAG